MSGWWTSSTAAKSRALNASSPLFISASRRAVRLVSVVAVMMAPFLVGDTSVDGRDDRDAVRGMRVRADGAGGSQFQARLAASRRPVLVVRTSQDGLSAPKPMPAAL